MCNGTNIVRFLADRNVAPEIISDVLSRLEEVTNESGRFFSSQLEYVLADQDLAQEYWAEGFEEGPDPTMSFDMAEGD